MSCAPAVLLETDRWEVKLRASGKTVCVRPANLRKGCFDSTVTGAIHDGDLETVRKWLEKGDADAIPMVDKRFSKKDRSVPLSLLQQAALENHPALVELLLNKHADPNRKFEGSWCVSWCEGHTALTLALNISLQPDDERVGLAERTQCIQLLLQAKARVDVRLLSSEKGVDTVNIVNYILSISRSEPANSSQRRKDETHRAIVAFLPLILGAADDGARQELVNENISMHKRKC